MNECIDRSMMTSHPPSSSPVGSASPSSSTAPPPSLLFQRDMQADMFATWCYTTDNKYLNASVDSISSACHSFPLAAPPNVASHSVFLPVGVQVRLEVDRPFMYLQNGQLAIMKARLYPLWIKQKVDDAAAANDSSSAGTAASYVSILIKASLSTSCVASLTSSNTNTKPIQLQGNERTSTDAHIPKEHLHSIRSFAPASSLDEGCALPSDFLDTPLLLQLRYEYLLLSRVEARLRQEAKTSVTSPSTEDSRSNESVGKEFESHPSGSSTMTASHQQHQQTETFIHDLQGIFPIALLATHEFNMAVVYACPEKLMPLVQHDAPIAPIKAPVISGASSHPAAPAHSPVPATATATAPTTSSSASTSTIVVPRPPHPHPNSSSSQDWVELVEIFRGLAKHLKRYHSVQIICKLLNLNTILYSKQPIRARKAAAAAAEAADAIPSSHSAYQYDFMFLDSSTFTLLETSSSSSSDTLSDLSLAAAAAAPGSTSSSILMSPDTPHAHLSDEGVEISGPNAGPFERSFNPTSTTSHGPTLSPDDRNESPSTLTKILQQNGPSLNSAAWMNASTIQALYYLSPECTGRMGSSHTVDNRSDLYSLGCIYYQLLTGQPVAFEGIRLVQDKQQRRRRSKQLKTILDTEEAGLEGQLLEILHCHLSKMPTPPALLVQKRANSWLRQSSEAALDLTTAPNSTSATHSKEHYVDSAGATSAIPQPSPSYVSPVQIQSVIAVLNSVILKLLSKSVHQRYQSCIGLMFDIEYCEALLNTTDSDVEFNPDPEQSPIDQDSVNNNNNCNESVIKMNNDGETHAHDTPSPNAAAAPESSYLTCSGTDSCRSQHTESTLVTVGGTHSRTASLSSTLSLSSSTQCHVLHSNTDSSATSELNSGTSDTSATKIGSNSLPTPSRRLRIQSNLDGISVPSTGLTMSMPVAFRRLTDFQQPHRFESKNISIGDFRVSQCIYGRDDSQRELLKIFNRVCTFEFSHAIQSDIQHQLQHGNDLDLHSSSVRLIARPELVLISGFSGIGKTSLIDVVQAPMLKARALFGRGKFDLYKRDSSIIFQSFEQLILYIMTRAPNERDYWKQELQSALQDEAQVVIDLIPLLGVLLGPQLPVVPMPPIDTQRRLTNRLTHFIRVFARINHPLVLFADDLQWADQHTIAILRILFQLEHVHLLILGAYRDNEVDEDHPITKFIQQLQQSEKETRDADQQQMDELKLPNKPQLANRITTVHLGPLQLKDINHMVADTLHCNTLIESTGDDSSTTLPASISSSAAAAGNSSSSWTPIPSSLAPSSPSSSPSPSQSPNANQGARLNTYALPLSQYLLKKTSGNPFYVNQLLKALYLTQQYFRFDFECRCWRYDITAIEAAPLSGDIIDIISMQIKALAPTAVKLICIMSCIGNQATLQQLLQTIRMDKPLTTESQVAKDLWTILQSGFLVALDAAFISQLFILAFEPSASVGLGSNSDGRDPNVSVPIPTSTFRMTPLLKMKFRFLHDRVQQSAYSLLQPADRIKIHLSIGRGALTQLHSTGLIEELETEMVKCVPGQPQTTSRISLQQANAGSTSLPDIAGHFAHCVELIESDIEIRELLLVCISAGRKAKLCTAYDAALKFAKLAQRILVERMPTFWSMKDKPAGRVSFYELSLIIHLLMAEAYFQLDFEACSQTIHEALAHVDDSPDNLLVRVAFRELIQFAELTQNRYLSSLNTGLETFEMLNYSLPPLEECEQALKDEEGFYQKMLAIVEQAPQRSATDPTECAIARVSLSVLSAAYFLNHEKFINVCYGALKHASQVGPTPMMSFALSFFTHICHKYQMLDLCYRIGCLAKTCVERYGLEAQPFRVRVYSSFSVAVSHWRGSVHAALKPIEAANSMCLEAGDLEYWSYTSFFGLDALFFAGRAALETVEQTRKNAIKSYQRKKLPVALTYLNLWRICIAKLLGKMGENDEEMCDDAEVTDEEKSNTDCSGKARVGFTHSQLMAPLRAANAVTFLFAGYTAEFTFGYFSRQFERVVPLVKECFELPDWKQNGLVVIPPAVFYAGLSLLASVNQWCDLHSPRDELDPSIARQRVLDSLPRIELMRSWSKFARVNYWHKYQLMEAERMQAEIFTNAFGQDGAIIQPQSSQHHLIYPCLQMYSEAIAGAVENQFSQDEIIANELCARFCLRVPLLIDCAGKYVKAAYVASVRWGCRMKMKQLSEQFPQFIRQKNARISMNLVNANMHPIDTFDRTGSLSSVSHNGEEQVSSPVIASDSATVSHETKATSTSHNEQVLEGASLEPNSIQPTTPVNDTAPSTVTSELVEASDDNARLNNSSRKQQQQQQHPILSAKGHEGTAVPSNVSVQPNKLEILPVLPRPIPMMSRLHLTSTPSSLDRHLDSVAIMRACMTFSAETNLDRLLTRVMHLVITYSSATKGVFLLNQLSTHKEKVDHGPSINRSDDSISQEGIGSYSNSSANKKGNDNSGENDASNRFSVDSSSDPLSKWNVHLIATSEDGFDESSRSSLATSRRNSKDFLLGQPSSLPTAAAAAGGASNHHMLKIASSPSSLPHLSSGLVIPLSVLNLASSTGTVCVMSGADLQQDSFRQDVYLQRYSPPSVLLLPIVWQTKTLGMLYLENAYHESAFSSSIIHCVQLISVQAALSIENARITAKLQSSMLDAQRATRAKSDFINSVSHELRTPLNAVIGVTRLLGETEMSEEQTSLLHIIHSSSKLLLGIISDILDFSRLEAGKVELDEQVVSSLECVESAVHLCSEIAAQNGLELVYFIQPNVPAYVKLDHTHMQQVLLNLISNALKFSRKGVVTVKVGIEGSTQTPASIRSAENQVSNYEVDSKLPIYALNTSPEAGRSTLPQVSAAFSTDNAASLETTQQSSHPSVDDDEVTLEISVSDNGCGIPSDALPHLFNSFTQADSSIRRTHGGAGLGLAIAKRIVQAMNGRIWITSTVGVGTIVSFTVRVKLPSLVEMKEVWRVTKGNEFNSSFRYEPRQTLYVDAIQPTINSPAYSMRSDVSPSIDSPSLLPTNSFVHSNLDTVRLPRGGILLVCNSATQPGARYMLESLLVSAFPSAISSESVPSSLLPLPISQLPDVVCVDTIEAAARAWEKRSHQSTPFFAVVLHVERLRNNHSIHQTAQFNVDSLLKAFQSSSASKAPTKFSQSWKLVVTGARWKPRLSSSAAAAEAAADASVVTFNTDDTFNKFDMDRSIVSINNSNATAARGISLTQTQAAWWPHVQVKLLLLPFRHRELLQLLVEPIILATNHHHHHSHSQHQVPEVASTTHVSLLETQPNSFSGSLATNDSNSNSNSISTPTQPRQLNLPNRNSDSGDTVHFASPENLSTMDLNNIKLDSSSSIISGGPPSPISLPPVTPGPSHRPSREFAKRIPNIQSKQPFELMLVEDNNVNIKMMTMLLAKLGWSLGTDSIALNGIMCLDKIDKALNSIEKETAKGSNETDSALSASASASVSTSPLSSNEYSPFDSSSPLMHLVRMHHLPQVILMDVSMDGMDGITCTERIVEKFSPRYVALGLPKPYVIACTANVTRENRKHCADAGMDGFIPKPVSLELLVTCLTRAGGHVFHTLPDTSRGSNVGQISQSPSS